MNMSDYTPAFKRLSEIYSLLGQPARLQIVALIGKGEVCVCHIKSTLGFRQAYISQQLMGLRKAGWVTTRRKGRKIYYSLTDARMLDLLEFTAKIFNLNIDLPQIPEVDGCAYYSNPITPKQ